MCRKKGLVPRNHPKKQHIIDGVGMMKQNSSLIQTHFGINTHHALEHWIK